MAYQYHIRQPEPEAEQFITLLQQLVGLGYKACRHYPHLRTLCKLYRNQFLQYDNGDFRKHLSILDTLAKNLAKMVQLAVQSYQALKHPDGYEAFFVLLKTILKPERLISMRQKEYAYQLLEELRQLA
jgi:hypothetical protein